MKSPFPGMDPYLEDPAFWSDFHFTFINYWREEIAAVLPGNYEARIGERVYVVNPPPEIRKKRGPDVMVVQTRKSRAAPAKSGGTVTLEPVAIPSLILEEVREAFIKVIHRPDCNVIAVLELLSPTNKASDGREIYLRTRAALMFQHVHLVELDLLLGGRPIPMAQPLPKGDYRCLVTRRDHRPNSDVYAWNLADGLPTLPIPLVAPDADVLCDLASVFAIAFERGRCRQAFDYGKPPRVTLSSASKKWARQQVRRAEES